MGKPNQPTRPKRAAVPFVGIGNLPAKPAPLQIADALRLAEGREVAHLATLQASATGQAERTRSVQVIVAGALDALIENKPDEAQTLLRALYWDLDKACEIFYDTAAAIGQQKRAAEASMRSADAAMGRQTPQ